MARGLFLFLVICPFFIGTQAAHSQTSSTTTTTNTFKADSIRVAISPQAALYHAALAEQAHIYSGGAYNAYTLRTKGHQFFGSDVWTDAGITYHGIFYPRIPLLYDIANEAVVVVRPGAAGTPIKIQINPEQVSSFTMQGHHFVRLPAMNNLPAGFYDQLYQGTVHVLAKRQKTSLKQNTEISFTDKDTYYILKDGQAHRISSKGSVLKVFSDKRAELTQRLKNMPLNFKQNREAAYATIAREYDLLTSGR